MTSFITQAIPYLLWVALAGAMVGSIQHVAWSFASLSGGDMIFGYIQAIAVDIGILALAYGVQIRKRVKRPTTRLWVGVVVFSAVSTYANLLYGLAHLSDIGVGKLADLRPYILSAVLPLMVIYLSEVVSEDVQHAVEEADKKRKREQRRQEREASDDGAVTVDADIEKDHALDIMYKALTEDPGISKTKLAKLIGKSRGTVYNYLDELEQSGRIVIDDSGDIVVQSNGRKVTV